MINQQAQWLDEYSILDLGFSLIRQFLIQNNLTKTLSAIDSEMLRRGGKRINKHILIKILSIRNIVSDNQDSTKPYESCLEILIDYFIRQRKSKASLAQTGIDYQCQEARSKKYGVHGQRESDMGVKSKTQISRVNNFICQEISAGTGDSWGVKNQGGESNNLGNRVQENVQKKERNSKNQKGYNIRPSSGKSCKNSKIKDINRRKKMVDLYEEIKRQKQEEERAKSRRQKEKEQIKQQQTRMEQAKKEQARQEQLRQEQVRQEELRQQLARQQQLRQEQARQEQLRQEHIRQEHIRQEQIRQEQLRQEQLRQQQARQEQLRQEQLRQEQVRQEQQQLMKAKEQERLQKELTEKIQEDMRLLSLKKAKEKEQARIQKQARQQEKTQMQQQVRIQQQIEQQKSSLLKQGQSEKISSMPQVQSSQFKVSQQNYGENGIEQRIDGQVCRPKRTQMKRIKGNRAIKTRQLDTKNIQQDKAISTNETLQNLQNTEYCKQTPFDQYDNQPRNSEQKMVKMFGRKRKVETDNGQNDGHQTTKFKFDENFIDHPLGTKLPSYQYEPIQLDKIVLADSEAESTKLTEYTAINYTRKFIGSGYKKYIQKTINETQVSKLKQALFQGGSAVLPKAWSQGFILSPFKETPYGLQQLEGGPCGIIAALQCYFLKHLLYISAPQSQESLNNEYLRQNCLVAAIADILYKVKQNNKIVLALPPKVFTGIKIDYSGLKTITLDALTFQNAYIALHNFKSYFIGRNNHGVTVLMLCLLMTKGIDNVLSETDIRQSQLIGNHGHCTQQLVNLFITGTACSNVFDGVKVIESSDMKLKGIQNKSDYGFLTIFETLKYIEVGHNLKNPKYPFWIICKQFHYHVIFANHFLIAEHSKDIHKFDIVYFDGLYNCQDRIVITLQKYDYEEQLPDEKKVKKLPLIEQVMMTKWGFRKTNWNGSIVIL